MQARRNGNTICKVFFVPGATSCNQAGTVQKRGIVGNSAGQAPDMRRRCSELNKTSCVSSHQAIPKMQESPAGFPLVPLFSGISELGLHRCLVMFGCRVDCCCIPEFQNLLFCMVHGHMR